MARSFQAVVVLALLAYSVVLTIAFAEDRFELNLFVLLWPAALVLGVAVSRWWMPLGPLVLSFGLGAIAFEKACPCYETDLIAFWFWWVLGMGMPGAFLCLAGVAIRRSLGGRPLDACRFE